MGERILLEAEPRSVGRARRFCLATLRSWGVHADITATAELLVSELATNAVLHARTPFTVIIARDEALRVEVRDGDRRLPRARGYGREAGSGRGLHLVEALARASGALETDAGKAVWFELDWSPGRHPSASGGRR